MAYIFESLYILAIDDEEGDLRPSIASALEPILAGAVLADLALCGCIQLLDSRIHVVDQDSTDNTVLDFVLFDILDTSRPRKLRYWLNTLQYKKIRDEIGHYLVHKGALVRKKKRLHLAVIPNQDPGESLSSQQDLKRRLQAIALASQPPEQTEKALLAFLYYGDLIKLVFPHSERKKARKQVKKLVADEETGSGLSESLVEIVVAACEAGYNEK